MRDQHRGKNELIDEVTGLRKQVADLKQAQLERRRIEDGLRRSEEQLRALLDAAPVGVCLLTQAGEPLLANTRLAGMLGYDSPQELVRLGASLGLIADEAGLSWLKDRAGGAAQGQIAMTFRRRDGQVVALPALGEPHGTGGEVAVVVVDGAMVDSPG
jgi:PAS domain S-box-containing protein